MLSSVLWFGLAIYLLVGLVVGVVWSNVRRNDFQLWERLYLLPWIVVSWPVPAGATIKELYFHKFY